MDATHDPGTTAGLARARGLERHVEPLRTRNGTRILIGVASWTDPSMTASGVFYPDGVTSAEGRLRYYASRFPLVEVDSTYYAIPAQRTSELWVERTPDAFTFDVKAHALMTGQPSEVDRLPKAIRDALPERLAQKPRVYAHELPGTVLDSVWAAFLQSIEPLRATSAADRPSPITA